MSRLGRLWLAVGVLVVVLVVDAVLMIGLSLELTR